MVSALGRTKIPIQTTGTTKNAITWLAGNPIVRKTNPETADDSINARLTISLIFVVLSGNIGPVSRAFTIPPKTPMPDSMLKAVMTDASTAFIATGNWNAMTA